MTFHINPKDICHTLKGAQARFEEAWQLSHAPRTPLSLHAIEQLHTPCEEKEVEVEV